MTKTLYNCDLLVEQILLVDSLTRAGKRLLGKVVAALEGIEFPLYNPLIEHVAIFNKAHIGSNANLGAYLRMNLNNVIYDRAIGRNLNTRKTDDTSILKSEEISLYQERTTGPEGMTGINLFKSQNRLPSFLTHECLSSMDFFLEVCPEMMMINIQRHPVDVAMSWIKQGWGERFGRDPLAFCPTLEFKSHPVPWFCEKRKEEYVAVSATEKVLISLQSLYEIDFQFLESGQMSPSKILILCYEHFHENPLHEIQRMEKFFQRRPKCDLEKVIGEEFRRDQHLLTQRKSNLLAIKASANKRYVEELIAISQQYEKKWSLETCLN